MARAAVQIAVFLAVLTALAVPLGAYLQRVFGGGQRVALEGPLGPVERGQYRLLRIDPAEDQTWHDYAVSTVVFSAVCTLTAYALLRVQSIHPLNPTTSTPCRGTWDRGRRDRAGGNVGADLDAGLCGRRLLQRQLGDAV